MERELTVKFGTELKAGGDEALRQIGRSALDAKSQTDSLFRESNRGALAFAETVKGAGDAMRGTFHAGASELEKLRSQMQKTQATLHGNIGKVGVDKSRLNVKKKDNWVDELGDRLGVPKGLTQLGMALGALALTVKATDGAMKAYYGAFERGEFSPKKLNQNLRGMVEGIPVIGELWRHSDTPAGAESNRVDNAVHNWAAQNHQWLRPFMDHFVGIGASKLIPTAEVAIDPMQQISTEKRKYLDFRSQQEVSIASQKASIEADTRRRQAALQLELETQRGQRESALALRPAQFGISREAAAARSLAIRNVTGQLGYGRNEELEDVLRQVGYHEQKLRAGAESGAHLQGLAVRKAEVDRQAQMNQRAYQQSLAAENPLRERLKPFDEIGKIHDRLLDLQIGGRERMPGEKGALTQRLSQLQARTKNTTVEEELRMRRQLQGLEAETAARRQEANDAEQNALNLKVETENAVREAQEKQLMLGRQYYETLQAQAQALDKRKKDLTEEMGLAHPAHLRTALGISRKAKAGIPLTQSEIGFMQGHREWFGGQVQQVAAQRAAMGPTAGMIQELLRNSGIDVRRQEIERQVMEVKHALEVSITTDKAVIDQIAQQLTKAFYDFQQQIGAQLDNRLNGNENATAAQERAMFGNVW